MYLRARLSDDASHAWDAFATDAGVTMTALIEALGRDMAAGQWKPTKRVVDEARRIDHERRSR